MDNPAFFEILCEQCVRKNSFLIYYLLGDAFEGVGSMDGFNEATKVDAQQTESMDSGIAEAGSSNQGSSSGLEDNSASSEADNKDGSCQLAKLKAAYTVKNGTETLDESKMGSIFFTGEWRHLLCKCPACVDLYDAHEVSFILNREDMTSHYEANSLKTVEEREEKAFAAMPHVAKMEFLNTLNGFKERLGTFLENASSGGTVTITKRHVEAFFEDEYRRREDRKRQRTGLPPSDCGTAGR